MAIPWTKLPLVLLAATARRMTIEVEKSLQ